MTKNNIRIRRSQSPQEEIINAITHGLGVLFTLIAIPILLQKIPFDTAKNGYFAVLIFGFGLLAVYLSSTFYHAVKSPKLKQRLHICDHASIFLLIGGSYVPFVERYTEGKTAIIFLISQWLIILLGVVLKLFFTGKYEKMSLFAYLFLGWSAFFLFKSFVAKMPFAVFQWVLIGGLSYTIGVIFYRWDKQKFAHAIWHLFVLGGSIAHFIAIWKINDFVRIN
jgi:hemolysin III